MPSQVRLNSAVSDRCSDNLSLSNVREKVTRQPRLRPPPVYGSDEWEVEDQPDLEHSFGHQATRRIASENFQSVAEVIRYSVKPVGGAWYRFQN